MAEKWSAPGTFHLGINMAGAVSAGAYTAGVLDFLMEALEQWYAAKASPETPVPAHDLAIEVFSGASAGGMCAAISAVMVQGDFEHIRKPSDPNENTTNKFYQSWVNKIDIVPLLGETDLANNAPVISLLDSKIIDEIADYAIAPGAPIPRPYIADTLTLFLTLTNVRGVPFALTDDAKGSAEEQIAYYADRLQFETVKGNNAPQSGSARPLPVGAFSGENPPDYWPLLKEAAKATGAFPLFLAPRQLDRTAGEYFNSPWASIATENPTEIDPLWTLKPGDPFQTLNVDGGVTDNDPFQLAHDYMAVRNPLATKDPETGDLANPRSPERANAAVLTVAPFPSQASFNANYNFAQQSSIFGMLPNLFTVLIAQSRFLGESLSATLKGESYSRFVMAPSDPSRPADDALQCGLLSAFGGFFERGFRAHDYQLGRRNCQKFLKDYFRLSVENPIIKQGLTRYDAAASEKVKELFDPGNEGTLPIIPLCGTAADEVPMPDRATITSKRVDQILDLIVSRLKAVAEPLLNTELGNNAKDFFARHAIDLLIDTLGKDKVKKLIEKELDGLIQG